MSSRDPRTDPSTEPDLQDLDELCQADEKRLIGALMELRARVAHGRFGEIDRALGLKPGWLGRVFRGEKTISHRRLIRLIRVLEEEPGRFFARVFPSRHDRAAPIGLLPRLIERPARVEAPAWRDRVLEWGRSVEITDKGQKFDHDPKDLLQLRQEDFKAAERVGIAAVECFVGLSRDSLDRKSVVPMAKWLTIVATILRSLGDRFTAAEIFDLAFVLERSIADEDCLAFVYRNACYLLCDWGELEEAEHFARQAISFSGLAGDSRGMGLSHYAHGVISSYRGQPDLALKMFEASLHNLDQSQPEALTCALKSISLHYLEANDLRLAEKYIRAARKISAELISAPTRARLALAEGELASLKGDVSEADRSLTRSAELFEECGGASELAMVGLFVVRHSIRHRRIGRAQTEARTLIQLSNDPGLDKVSRAILLEIARMRVRGEGTVTYLAKAIIDWQKPRTWAARSGRT